MSSSANAALKYDELFTDLSKRRQPSPIRTLMPLLKIPGMISLGGGLPNSALFPFKKLSMEVSVPDGKGAEEMHTLELSQEELNEALQYSPTPGLPRLVKTLTDMQQREHNPPHKDWSLSVTNGSQEGLAKVFEMLLGEADTLLLEDPSYSGALAFLQPLGCGLAGIPTDDLGLLPDKLRDYLTNFTPTAGKKFPRVLYTIPTGQNPAGTTANVARKREIYAIAKEFNLLILEDDPYYYLAYGDLPASDFAAGQFQRLTVPSFWSMDTDGRVVRFDSFSKVLSSGLRLGVVCGPSPIMTRLNLHTQATNLHPSGMSQSLVAKLLTLWGEAGWEAHVNRVSYFYMQRRDTFIGLCEKYLKGKVTWTTPTAGMFVWFHVPGVKDTKALIEQKAVDAKFLMVPGQAFSPNNEKSSHVRAAFSVASEEEMEQAVQRFAALVDAL